MKSRKGLATVAIVVLALIGYEIVLALIGNTILLFSASMSERGSFVNREPKRIVEVPRSWGKPVSIARRPVTVTILFENGHVITVAHGLISLFGNYFYTVKIVYVDE